MEFDGLHWFVFLPVKGQLWIIPYPVPCVMLRNIQNNQLAEAIAPNASDECGCVEFVVDTEHDWLQLVEIVRLSRPHRMQITLCSDRTSWWADSHGHWLHKQNGDVYKLYLRLWYDAMGDAEVPFWDSTPKMFRFDTNKIEIQSPNNMDTITIQVPSDVDFFIWQRRRSR